MLFGEILRMAFRSLGANKLRSILTMAGITIGVFSVIGVMTTVSALRGSIETGLSFLGTNMFQFAKWPTGISSGGQDRRKYQMRRDITLDEAQRYMKLMEGTSDVICLKVFNQDGSAQAVYENRKTTPGLTFGGSNEHFITANQYSIETGRNLTAGDVDLGRPVVIIGQTIVQKLFPTESPLGKVIKISGRTYTVIGTFAPKGSAFGQSQDDILIVPITRYLSDFGSEGVTVNIATQAPSQTMYNETIDKAITAMRIVRGLQPEDENDFELYSNDSLIAAFAKIADAVRAGALVISAIALLAAGVGIMNIMLVSVTERTKEIGIRKSIGARKKSVLTQFLVESVVISLAGGLAGILLGICVGNGVAVLLKASIVFPWDWAAIGLAVCSGIGVGFGFYPAWKAASLDPIEALRYE
ncbi:ABC transporter permease [Horticoccus luteus]|uniref:ABC transporter permease n=2 Tax=Horticoccus luteus TaxID=2862869 RepID=A0A8F9TUN1_9BACT|nr:ABC transporter permease [Horticoccus luteus]